MSNLFRIDVDAEMEYRPNQPKSPFCVVMERGNERLSFPLSMIITKRGLEKLDAQSQFYIINDYINRKGDEFEDMVFSTYVSICKRVEQFEDALGVKPLDVFTTVKELFDLFNIDELIEHARMLVENGVVNIPSKLPDVSDQEKVNDGIRSEEQTYLKSDYLNLVGLVSFIKATFPLLILVDMVFLNEKTGPRKDRVLYEFYRNYEALTSSLPFKKLREFTEQIALGPKREETDIKKQMIEKSLSREELPDFFLAQLIVEHVTILPVLRDNDASHSVNTMYNFLISRIENKGGANSKVLEFSPIISSKDDEVRSLYESIESTQDIIISTPAILNHGLKTLERTLKQFTMYPRYQELLKGVIGNENEVSIEEIHKCFEVFKDPQFGSYIPNTSVTLIKCFCKKIMDPRFVPVLDLNSITNLLPVAFVYMYNLGFKHLAFLLGCVDNQSPDMFTVYAFNDLKKLDPVTQEELRIHFQCHIPPNKKNNTYTYIIEERVNLFAKEIMDNAKISLLPVEIVSSLFTHGVDYVDGNEPNERLLATNYNLRNDIAKFLIKNEECINQ